MHIRHVSSSRTARRVLASAGIVGLALGAAACGSDDGDSGGSGGTEDIGVALITKDSSNPFFVAMQKGAKADAAKNGVNLTIASGKQEGDDAGQIAAIEQAVVRGDKGILITPMSDRRQRRHQEGPRRRPLRHRPRHPARTRRTPSTSPSPRTTARPASSSASGRRATLDGGQATIALLDLFNDKIVSVDYDRDQGFLEGMGIDVADPKKNGDEAKTGKYTGGKGGDYTIVCNEPSNGAEDGGRTAMETCLSKSDGINVVYTINEPAAVGASAALKAAGITDALVVSVDGGCAGVKSVKDGTIGATAQQYPLKMATLGMEAIAKIARGGEKPTTSDGLDFFNTGVALVTDKPAAGVDSITSDAASKICWG